MTKSARTMATIITVTVILLASTSITFAAPGVLMTADVPGNMLDVKYVKGDIVPVTLYVSSTSEEAVFGVELEIATKGKGARIQSVTFNPAFSAGAGADRLKLPAKRFKATRTQPMGSLNRNLGTSGKRVEFATIEIEMLTGRPFADALDISARASLIGKAPESITVLGTETNARGGSHHKGKGRGQLAVFSGVEPSADGKYHRGESDYVPWTYDEATITLTIRKPGNRAPVTTLQAGHPYELHYDATPNNLDGYILLTMAADKTQRLQAVKRPRTGEWSATASVSDFTADVTGESNTPATSLANFGLPTGMRVLDMVSDVREEDRPASPTGHLFTFTPSGAGTLHFVLMSWEYNDDAVHQTNMTTTLTLPILSPR